MYAYESPQFNSGMLLNYLTDHLAEIGKATGLAMLLAAKVNWRKDAGDFGPCGTINHFTIKKIARVLGCSESTVNEHLSILRAAGIIESEPVIDQHGAISYCRMWFSGFVTFLRERASVDPEASRPASAPPSNPSEGGGSEKPDPDHIIRNQKIIDLDEVKSVRFSFLEAVIRDADPKLANGLRADAQMVFDRFRSFNLSKGKHRISIAALRGFARRFTEFRARKPEPEKAQITTPAAEITPQPTATPASLSADASADARMKAALRTRCPEAFDAWFAKLDFDQHENCLQVKAPSKFVGVYVRDHFETVIQQAAGAGARVVFA